MEERKSCVYFRLRALLFNVVFYASTRFYLLQCSRGGLLRSATFLYLCMLYFAPENEIISFLFDGSLTHSYGSGWKGKFICIVRVNCRYKISRFEIYETVFCCLYPRAEYLFAWALNDDSKFQSDVMHLHVPSRSVLSVHAVRSRLE